MPRLLEEIATVAISMHQLAAGTFTHFLSSLSDLLDHAAAHAEKRKTARRAHSPVNRCC